MTQVISATRVATLAGDFDRSPAYAGLAGELRLLIGDGRLPLQAQLPSERDLSEALALSRTTITRAYAELRESGYAESRRGAGTFTRLPGGRRRTGDRLLAPTSGRADLIDLTCSAPTAPAGIAAAYEAATDELPAWLGGHGYFPAGVPVLQEALAARYTEEGLPTDPDQVLVTVGAQSAAAIVAHALITPGDRMLVENPTYPNASRIFRRVGARAVATPVDPAGWDLETTLTVARQATARFAYLVPDFHNPTGNLMTDQQREAYAAELGRSQTLAIVDESHRHLPLEGQPLPAPFAAHLDDAISIGSASKALWGGLRLGWIRTPHRYVDRLIDSRLGLDLGASVLEQLVLARILADPDAIRDDHRTRLRGQRDALVAQLREQLPGWRFRVPGGGLALWIELPEPRGPELALTAERHGVALAPGPTFALEGGLRGFVRLPWIRPEAELVEAVARLKRAWAEVADSPEARQAHTTQPVMVA